MHRSGAAFKNRIPLFSESGSLGGEPLVNLIQTWGVMHRREYYLLAIYMSFPWKKTATSPAWVSKRGIIARFIYLGFFILLLVVWLFPSAAANDMCHGMISRLSAYSTTYAEGKYNKNKMASWVKVRCSTPSWDERSVHLSKRPACEHLGVAKVHADCLEGGGGGEGGGR